MPAPMPKVAIDTPVKAGLRNSDRSNMGRSWRSSTITNTTSSTAAAPRVDDDAVARPAVVVAPGEPEDEEEQPTREGDQARPVEPLGPGVRHVHHAPAHQEGQHADGDVHVEDPLPSEGAREGSAHERADGHRPAHRGPPHGDGGRPGRALEVLADERQRGGEHGRPPDALDGPGRDELGRGVRQPARQGGQGEHGQADDEDALAPEAVGQRPLGEDQRPTGSGRRPR